MPQGEKETEIANVEAQTTSKAHMTDRLLAYSCRLYGEQLKAGLPYKKLHRVYSLMFTTQNLPAFKNSPRFDHVCTIRENQAPYTVFSEGCVLSLLNSLNLKEKWRNFLTRSSNGAIF